MILVPESAAQPCRSRPILHIWDDLRNAAACGVEQPKMVVFAVGLSRAPKEMVCPDCVRALKAR
jgi:hypothetical protein